MERIVVWQRCWAKAAAGSRSAAEQLWPLNQRCRQHMAQLDAEVITESTATLVLILPPRRLAEVVRLALALAAEAERDSEGALRLMLAVTVGPLARTAPDGTYTGGALDRAESLAHALTPGEIALDADAHVRCGQALLCSRTLTPASETIGVVLDRRYPWRAKALATVSRLHSPSLWPQAQVQLQALKHLAMREGRRRIVLVGAYGSGATAWLQELARSFRPSVWLDVQALGAFLAPLSALAQALRALPDAHLRTTLSPDAPEDASAYATLEAVIQGRSVPRREVVMALRQYLGRSLERTKRPGLITVNPVALIDTATLGVVTEVAREGGPQACVVLRILPGTKPPPAFVRAGAPAELRLPKLTPRDAQTLASSMLGSDSAPDIAQQAAAMGGASPLGVAEAVRLLVGSGDVVYDQGFRWRLKPAGRASLLGIDLLLEQRIGLLTKTLRSVLEVLSCIPGAGDRGLLEALCVEDDVSPEQLARALRQLAALQLVAAGPRVSPSVRHAVTQLLSPARRTALYARMADALQRRISAEAPFAQADVAYCLAQSGRLWEAADVFLQVSMAAGQAGFVRSGVQLAAAAVECQPTAATRAKAAKLAESLNPDLVGPARGAGGAAPPATRAKPDSVRPPPGATSLSVKALEQVVEALRAQDFDVADRALELVTAAGQDGPHILRLRAMVQLARGNRADAQGLLTKAQSLAVGSSAVTQGALASALVLLDDGATELAIRDVLRGLANARAQRDWRGERAALSLLAACYRRLDRPSEAERLQHAARALLAEAPSGSPRP